ncbi:MULTISPECIES: MATE family efflux transporter [Pseudomonadota]|uniref:MATE efflux family protein n=1 Tax=Chelativorans sp. (strain BNC1) TaxID=266779 RepID=Q11H92_CHESB|nr:MULTISPECIES: MATE family efflux transporter [Chelativorans]
MTIDQPRLDQESSPGSQMPATTVTHGQVLKIALPITLASISTPLVGIVDTAVVGQLGNEALIGGIAAANVIINLVFFTFNFLRSSTTAMVSQAFGAGHGIEMLAHALRAICLAFAAGLIAVALQWPIAYAGFSLLGVGEDVRAAGMVYFGIRVWSAPLLLVNYALVGWLFGQGSFLPGLALQAVLNLVNAILSIAFVLHFDWGVAGAALATVAAETATALAGGILIARALHGKARAVLSALPDMRQLKRILSINADILLRSMIRFFSIALFTRESAAFGTAMLAANVVLMNLFYFSGAMIQGLAVAAQHLAGRAVGGCDRVMFETSVNLSVFWSVATGFAVAAVYLIVQDPIIALMTASPDVRALAHAYFHWALLTAPLGSLAFVMDGVFIGATWARDIRNMMLVASACYLLLIFTLIPWLGNDGLWIAFLAFLAVRGFTLRWRMNRLMSRTFPLPSR